MYVRQMQNSDEEWLFEQIEKLDIDEPAFRSRDYILALDPKSGERFGFGRFYRHDGFVQFSHITVLDDAEAPDRVRELIYRNLFTEVFDNDFDTVYVALEGEPDVPFDFEAVDGSDVPESVRVEDGETVYRADVYDALGKKTEEEKRQELADEFGYEDATTKYSIN